MNTRAWAANLGRTSVAHGTFALSPAPSVFPALAF